MIKTTVGYFLTRQVFFIEGIVYYKKKHLRKAENLKVWFLFLTMCYKFVIYIKNYKKRRPKISSN